MKSYCGHIGDPTQCPFCDEDEEYNLWEINNYE